MLTQSLLLLDGFQEEIYKEKYAHKISLNSNLNYCTPPPPQIKKTNNHTAQEVLQRKQNLLKINSTSLTAAELYCRENFGT